MLVKNVGPMRVMGFARYEKASGAQVEDVVAAALRWQEDFLAKQDGIAFHVFLGNLRGGFADLILARDEAAFAAMAGAHAASDSGKAFVQLLDRDSIRLCRSAILKDDLVHPSGFSCVEFGTFRLAPGGMADSEDVRTAAGRVEEKYLRASENTRAHLVGRIDDENYCEVVFGRTLAETRRTCMGYVGNPDCEPLLRLVDPASVDLDFWYLLA